MARLSGHGIPKIECFQVYDYCIYIYIFIHLFVYLFIYTYTVFDIHNHMHIHRVMQSLPTWINLDLARISKQRIMGVLQHAQGLPHQQ